LGPINYVNIGSYTIDVNTMKEFKYWVKNSTGSNIYSTQNIKLEISTLGYPRIDMNSYVCTINKILSSQMNSCDTELRPDDDMPPGQYHLKIIGSQNGVSKFLAIQTISINNDQKPDYIILNKSPKTLMGDQVCKWNFLAKKNNYGFGGLPHVIFYLEHEGNKQVVYNTYVQIIIAKNLK